jgi:hypothetical protein
MEPVLRVYEGCARAYLGEMEGANIVKLHHFSAKVSYLFYPDFDTVAHPVLLRSLKVSLRALQLLTPGEWEGCVNISAKIAIQPRLDL